MKQRLALALALLADPPVLLLDEPTSNLDARTRDEFIDLLVDLRRGGKTLLFTSHHAEEVDRLADQVLVLEDGRVAAHTWMEDRDGRRRTEDEAQERVTAIGSLASEHTLFAHMLSATDTPNSR